MSLVTPGVTTATAGVEFERPLSRRPGGALRFGYGCSCMGVRRPPAAAKWAGAHFCQRNCIDAGDAPSPRGASILACNSWRAHNDPIIGENLPMQSQKLAIAAAIICLSSSSFAQAQAVRNPSGGWYNQSTGPGGGLSTGPGGGLSTGPGGGLSTGPGGGRSTGPGGGLSTGPGGGLSTGPGGGLSTGPGGGLSTGPGGGLSTGPGGGLSTGPCGGRSTGPACF